MLNFRKTKNIMKKFLQYRKLMDFFAFVAFLQLLFAFIIFLPNRPIMYSNGVAYPLIRTAKPTTKTKIKNIDINYKQDFANNVYVTEIEDNETETFRDVKASEIFTMLPKRRCSGIKSITKDNWKNMNINTTLLLGSTGNLYDPNTFQSCMIRSDSQEDAISSGCRKGATCETDQAVCYQSEFCYYQTNGVANLCVEGLYNDFCVRSGSLQDDQLFYNLIWSFVALSVFGNLSLFIVLVWLGNFNLRELLKCVKGCSDNARRCYKSCRCCKKKEEKQDNIKNESVEEIRSRLQNESQEKTKQKLKERKRKRQQECCRNGLIVGFAITDLAVITLSAMCYHLLVRKPGSGEKFFNPDSSMELEPNMYDSNNVFDEKHPVISPVLTEYCVPALLLITSCIGVVLFFYRIILIYAVLFPDEIPDPDSEVTDDTGNTGNSSGVGILPSSYVDENDEKVFVDYTPVGMPLIGGIQGVRKKRNVVSGLRF